MDFLAILIQEKEGCDYTIGCGIERLSFWADSWDDAVEYVKKKVIGFWPDPTDGDYPGYWGGRKLETVSLVQVVREKRMPVQEWYIEGVAEREEVSRQALEETERQVYERLKQKFEEGDK